MDLTAVHSATRFRWDTPYRFLPSLFIVVACFTWSRPTDGLQVLAEWAGLEVASNIQAVQDWLLDPSRREIIAAGAMLTFMAAVAATVSLAMSLVPPGNARAASTAVLSFALILETGIIQSDPWLAALAFLSLALAAVVANLGRRWRKSEAYTILFLDVIYALAFVVIGPLLWATIVSHSPGTGGGDGGGHSRG